jgi:chemotaxis signal transduction protein
MRYLLFSVGHRRLCLPVADVERVLSPDSLKPAYAAPKFVKGLLSYQSLWVPVIDLCLLADGQACKFAMSTRLILIQLPDKTGEACFVGVIAESVDETMQVADENFTSNGLSILSQNFFGDITTENDELIYRLVPEQLLSKEVRQLIRLETEK